MEDIHFLMDFVAENANKLQKKFGFATKNQLNPLMSSLLGQLHRARLVYII